MGLGVASAVHAGEAEIEDLDLSERPRRPGNGLQAGWHVRHEQVGRLDVAVDHAAFVSVPQAVGHLADVFAGDGNGQRPVLRHEALQVYALDELHDQIAQRLARFVGDRDFPSVEGLDDVGVAQRGQGLHLAGEALHEDGVAVALGGQHLEGHGPFHVDVFGLVDHAHAAAAEPVEDAVVAQHQAERFAGQQPLHLIVRYQSLGDQGFGQDGRVVAAQARPLGEEGVQLLATEQPAVHQGL